MKNHKLAEKEVELKWLVSKAEILHSMTLKHEEQRRKTLMQIVLQFSNYIVAPSRRHNHPNGII